MATYLKSKLKFAQREADLYLKAIKSGGNDKHFNFYFM